MASAGFGPGKNPAPRKLLICTTPRTSSNSLLGWMHAAGLGLPDELFHRDTIAENAAKWNLRPKPDGSIDLNIYAGIAMQNLAVNGIFSAKFQYAQFERLIRADVARTVFKDAVVIYLHRNDLAAQAASYLTALETGTWLPGNGRPPQPRDPNLPAITLAKAINTLAHQDMSWRKFFAYAQIKPVCISAEDVNHSAVETIVRIGHALGREIDAEALRRSHRNLGKYEQDRDRKRAIIRESSAELTELAFRPDTYRVPDARPKSAPKRMLFGAVWRRILAVLARVRSAAPDHGQNSGHSV